MTYTLYIGNKRYSSWSMRPWVLLTALDIPFEEKLHFFKPSRRQPDFLSFSPTGKVPCLHDGETTVWDSLAIVEYVAEAHPSVWPADKAARAWARCATSEMHSGFDAIRDECSFNAALRIELPSIADALQRDLDRLGELFNEGLERFGGPWLAGKEFTAVDAFYAAVASRCQTYGLELRGEADAYVKRLLEQPAVARWLEEGIAEEVTEPVHETDCVRDRRVLKDLSKAK